MAYPNAPRAIIFDIDGTLVDSNDAHTRAWLDVLQERGYSRTYEHVRHLIGMGSDKVLPELTGVSADTNVGQEIAGRQLEIFEQRYLPYLQAFPGTRALALRLRDSGMKLVVATSAHADVVSRLLRTAEVEDLIDDVTTTDDARASKPDPDIVSAALRRAGEPADRVIMIGDTPYDIEAAARAGVRAIALRCGGGWSEQDLADAIAVYDDPLGLLLDYDQSPLVGRAERMLVAPAAGSDTDS